MVADPFCADSFVAGYESEGAVYSGTSTTRENFSADTAINADEVGDNFDIVTTNTDPQSIAFSSNTLRQMQKGCLFVFPAGSNFAHYHSYMYDYFQAIIAGSGYEDNATGYLSEFYGIDPQAKDVNIEYIIPTGSYETDVVSIERLAPTDEHPRILKLRVLRNSYNENFFGTEQGRGMPFRVSEAITGTDILPLPSGLILAYTSVKLTSYIDLYFQPLTLTAGTIGGDQPVTTGKIKLKSSDSNILIKTDRDLEGQGFYAPLNWAVQTRGVTGFDNNPNGVFGVVKWLGEIDGYYDKVEVAHTTGVGGYLGGGILRVDTQSYATPYIAGQLAYIKDALELLRGESVSWWEVRFRARITATGASQYSTYGRINVRGAIAYSGYILPDPFITLGEIGNITIEETAVGRIVIHCEAVDNASSYDLYRDGAIVGSHLTQSEVANYSGFSAIGFTDITEHRNNFTYKAYTGDRASHTEMSTGVRYKRYKFTGVLVTKKHVS